MSEDQLDGLLDIRKPGAHLDDGAVPDEFVLMLGSTSTTTRSSRVSTTQ
jgi:hypothetical protein